MGLATCHPVCMSTTAPRPKTPTRVTARAQVQLQGVALLFGIVLLMWLVEVINWADSYRLDNDGIYPRSLGHLWGIFTAPFIHANFAPHLLDNTIPLVFMGFIIALSGAVRLAKVTLIVILVGGIGTWLVAPAHTVTIGASGIVFGYATYLFTRGFFDRSLLELLTGLFVGVIWGGALVASVVPHAGVSWQGHVCGAIGGVVAAVVLRSERPPARQSRKGTAQPAGVLSK